jgi:glycosyltransferase involved in cell wall biosynthesis
MWRVYWLHLLLPFVWSGFLLWFFSCPRVRSHFIANRSMKILYLAPQPFFIARGTPIGHRLTLRALSESGYAVDVLTYHLGEDISIPQVTIHRIRKIPWITHVPIGFSLRKLLLDVLLFWKACSMLRKGRYDMLHANEETAFFSIFLSKHYHLSYVYQIHSIISDYLVRFQSWSNPLLLRVVRHFEKSAIVNAGAVMVWTQAYSTAIQKLVPEVNIVVTGYPIHLDIGAHATQEEILDLRRRWKVTSNDLILLYTGNFAAYQNIDTLIQSFSRVRQKHPHIKLVLVGGSQGEQHSIQAMIALVEQLGLQSDVIFEGEVPIERIPLYLESGDIMLSAYQEALNPSMKVINYLAVGKPLVSRESSLLNDDVAMIVRASGDQLIERFADAISRLIEDENLRAELGRKGQAFAQQAYSYPYFRQQLQRVYQETLGGVSGSR